MYRKKPVSLGFATTCSFRHSGRYWNITVVDWGEGAIVINTENGMRGKKTSKFSSTASQYKVEKRRKKTSTKSKTPLLHFNLQFYVETGSSTDKYENHSTQCILRSRISVLRRRGIWIRTLKNTVLFYNSLKREIKKYRQLYCKLRSC